MTRLKAEEAVARKSEQGARGKPSRDARSQRDKGPEPGRAPETAATGYRAVTRDIEVSVEPFYMADRSDPEESRYVWAYRITIDNQSDEFVKLLSRYWHITDGDGRVEEVRGPGVVGEQPELRPGDSYQYTSGCPLSTPSGIMVGAYTMRNGRGEEFEIDIPAFSLDLPDQTRTVN